MSQLKWTSSLPSEAGFYFWRDLRYPDLPVVGEVKSHPNIEGSFYFYGSNGCMFTPTEDKREQWAGPIELPKEKEIGN